MSAVHIFADQPPFSPLLLPSSSSSFGRWWMRPRHRSCRCRRRRLSVYTPSHSGGRHHPAYFFRKHRLLIRSARLCSLSLSGLNDDPLKWKVEERRSQTMWEKKESHLRISIYHLFHIVLALFRRLVSRLWKMKWWCCLLRDVNCQDKILLLMPRHQLIAVDH